ncbi:LysR family transcriptional regulator [Actinocorallia sp. A-T 12471]|uniref:LysR family transcriptional regulator n=1 Tax=Actinocorallia sp. A-T 12471 TaxID=3089813 RepID=UPI0029D40849|nr:LysR family transcriptional regulator [Actinocorallia sp. A-T 12471]MDX6740626.1 LysR family transcriptional regulator [Actinocorallia sp. A-T 12471]
MRDAEPSGLAHLQGVDLNLLVHLYALLEEQSVTRAAGRVGLSQPAMSHSLARCRKLLGDELLVRAGSGQGLVPTARGRELVPVLGRLLRTVEGDVLGRPGFDPATSRRRFTLAATSATLMTVLPPLLRELATAAPGVSVHTVPSPPRTDDLADRPDVDLALVADVLPSTLPRERLYEDRWVAVVAATHPRADDGVTVEDLARYPHLAFEEAALVTPPYVAMAAEGLRPRMLLTSHDFLAIPLLLPGTDCVAVVQERLTARLGGADLLRTFPLPFPVAPLGIDMVWNPRAAQDPACVWLRTHLRTAVRPQNP